MKAQMGASNLVWGGRQSSKFSQEAMVKKKKKKEAMVFNTDKK